MSEFIKPSKFIIRKTNEIWALTNQNIFIYSELYSKNMARKTKITLYHESLFKDRTDVQILETIRNYIIPMQKDEFYKRSYSCYRTFPGFNKKISSRFYAKFLLDVLNMKIVLRAFNNKTNINSEYILKEGLENFYKGTIKETYLLRGKNNLKTYAYIVSDAISYHTDRYNTVKCPICGYIMDFYHTTWKYNIKCNNCGNVSKGIKFEKVYTPGNYKITDYKRLELYKKKQ